MLVRGVCKLCLKEADLCKSHYMPRALYPTKRHKSASITRDVIHSGQMFHVKEPLLCRDCETRFTQNGESEVLKWLAPKAKEFSLNWRLKVAMPREEYPDVSRFAAEDIGLDAAKFAYFAVSVIWRGAVHRWTLRDGTLTTPMSLSPHDETIRKYLVGEIGFPNQIASVIVIVCSDSEGRSVWGLPSQNFEAGCQNYRFIARGVFFRLLLEPEISPIFHKLSCVSPLQCILYGDCSRRVKHDFARVLATPLSR